MISEASLSIILGGSDENPPSGDGRHKDEEHGECGESWHDARYGGPARNLRKRVLPLVGNRRCPIPAGRSRPFCVARIARGPSKSLEIIASKDLGLKVEFIGLPRSGRGRKGPCTENAAPDDVGGVVTGNGFENRQQFPPRFRVMNGHRFAVLRDVAPEHRDAESSKPLQGGAYANWAFRIAGLDEKRTRSR